MQNFSVLNSSRTSLAPGGILPPIAWSPTCVRTITDSGKGSGQPFQLLFGNNIGWNLRLQLYLGIHLGGIFLCAIGIVYGFRPTQVLTPRNVGTPCHKIYWIGHLFQDKLIDSFISDNPRIDSRDLAIFQGCPAWNGFTSTFITRSPGTCTIHTYIKRKGV